MNKKITEITIRKSKQFAGGRFIIDPNKSLEDTIHQIVGNKSIRVNHETPEWSHILNTAMVNSAMENIKKLPAKKFNEIMKGLGII
jgi:hypothetical protein